MGGLTHQPHRLPLKFLGIPTSSSYWHGHLRFHHSPPYGGVCKIRGGSTPPATLDEKLKKAKQILERPDRRKQFTLTYYAYNLAHVIRNLHARLHESQTVGQGKTVRPEVGLNLTVTVSELLVEVGLGKY